MAVKIDINKAYDRVEWSFIATVLRVHGFDQDVVDLIVFGITSVSFHVLLNGSPTKTFSPRRGIRQEDPISPYIFILCSEVLSQMLIREERQSKIMVLKSLEIRQQCLI